MKANVFSILLVLFSTLFVKMFLKDLSIAEALVGLGTLGFFGYMKFLDTKNKAEDLAKYEDRIKNLEKILTLNSLSRK